MLSNRPPSILPEVVAELELHGVDAVRGILAASSDGHTGSGRNTPIKFGNVVAKRGEIEDWLKWHAATDKCWVKVGVIAAIAAAIFSLIGILK